MKKLIFFLIIFHESLIASPWVLDTGNYSEIHGDLKLKIKKENVVQFRVGDSNNYYQIKLKPYTHVRNEFWFVTDSIEKKKLSPQEKKKHKKIVSKKTKIQKKLVLGNIESKEDKALPAQLKILDLSNKYIFVFSQKKIQVIIFSKGNVQVQKHNFTKLP